MLAEARLSDQTVIHVLRFNFFSFFFLKIIYYLITYMHVCIFRGACTWMLVSSLNLPQATENHLTWVLGTAHVSSGGAARVPNRRAVFLAQVVQFLWLLVTSSEPIVCDCHQLRHTPLLLCSRCMHVDSESCWRPIPSSGRRVLCLWLSNPQEVLSLHSALYFLEIESI